MTIKEQRFEQLVNAVQARHDELSDLVEWRRRKDVEEEAITVYFELGQDLHLFIEQMRTFDQQETEYQCQRKGAKLRCLYPEMFPEQSRPWELKRQERTKTQEADERKREQQKINSVAVAKFKADVRASIDPIASTKCTTNAAGSQKASEEHRLRQLKPKNPRSDNQAAYSTRAGSSRQQEHKATLSVEEKRRQFGNQVRSRAEASRNTSQVASTPGAGSSRQQEPKATRSDEGKHPRAQDQVRSHSGTSLGSNQIASSAAAAPSRQYRLKATLSDGEKRRQAQDHVRAHSGTSHDSNQIASSAAAAPSKQAGHEAIPSAEGYGHLQSQEQSSLVAIHINNQNPSFTGVGLSTESHSHDQGRVMPARVRPSPSPPTITAIQSVTLETAAAEVTTTPSPITEAISSVTLETAAAAQRAYKKEFNGPVPAASEDSFTAELAGYQPRIGICHNVHYPKGAVLVNTGPGLAKVCLGRPSVVTQTLATDIGQGLYGNQATGSGTSSHDTSSQGSTPPSSLHSSPPKTPIMYPLNDAPTLQEPNTQHAEPDNVALFRQLEASTYGSLKSTNLFAKQKSSRRDDPFITSVLQGHFERMRSKTAMQELYKDWPHPHQQQQDDGYGYGRQQQQGWHSGVECGAWGRGPWN